MHTTQAIFSALLLSIIAAAGRFFRRVLHPGPTMTDKGEIIRSNARVILQHARGKSRAEREIMYANLRLGPFSYVFAARALAKRLRAEHDRVLPISECR